VIAAPTHRPPSPICSVPPSFATWSPTCVTESPSSVRRYVTSQCVALVSPLCSYCGCRRSTFRQFLNRRTDCLLTAIFGTTAVGLPYSSHDLVIRRYVDVPCSVFLISIHHLLSIASCFLLCELSRALSIDCHSYAPFYLLASNCARIRHLVARVPPNDDEHPGVPWYQHSLT
jgi:hypothetical protein